MLPATKRFIFASLFIAFFSFTVAVDTFGTSEDPALASLTEKGKKGKLLFQEYNCTACHQLYGLGGYMGPDLTNVISAPGKGALYARAFLQNGTQRMPNFHLSGEELDELIDYLTYVDKTGTSPVRNFSINYDGTVNVLR